MSDPTLLTAAQAADLAAALKSGGLPDDPAALIDLIGQLERLKSLACALQADATVAYDAARRGEESEQGLPARSRGQLMADLLVARVTVAELSPDAPTPVPVLVNLTMSDATLLGGHAAGQVGADGVAPEVVPAEIARLLLARALTAEIGAWIRQLYVDHTGRLLGMTSKQRFFADGLADFIGQRDLGICRTPFCDAPIRHRDHVTAVGNGGGTTADNGHGLCEACNHAKEAPGWRQLAVDDLRHSVETVTPSGHRNRSTAPPPIGWREPRWVKDRPGVYTLVA